MRQLLTKMKGKDGRRFWQCLSRSWNGTWKSTFIGKDKETLDQGGEMSMCLASHLPIVLSQRGFTKNPICKLIYASFDNLRVESANDAR